MSRAKTSNGKWGIGASSGSRSAKRVGRANVGSSLADVFSTPAYDCKLVARTKSQRSPSRAFVRAKRNGEGSDVSARSGNPDLRIVNACSDWPVASHLQREKRWRHASDTVRHDIHRFELSHGNVGAWPIRLLHYYLSRELLERIALDNAVASLFQLREEFLSKIWLSTNNKKHSLPC